MSPLIPKALLPIHARALGTAVGLTSGILLAAVTAFHLVARPENAPNLALLANYFYGYSISSWPGVGFGLLWGLVVGFMAGWTVGAVRNLTIFAWLRFIQIRASLDQDFLDDIG